MAMNNSEFAKYVKFVQMVVANWPSSSHAVDGALLSNINAHLAAGFDPLDLNIHLNGFSNVVSVKKMQDKIYVIFNDYDGYPHRASLVYKNSSVLKLKALKFQCPACFGNGVNMGQICTLCGGSGWGAQ
jgi:hypothetical protein